MHSTIRTLLLQRFVLAAFPVVALLPGCATVDKAPEAVEAPVSRVDQQEAQEATLTEAEEKLLKRKVAIGRFTNETRYGKTFLRDDDLDPLGKQAADMLANYLVESGKFLVFERQDMTKLEIEQTLLGEGKLIGVDALILGSVTEFGRSVEGKTGFLSDTKKQIAKAKVQIRMVDARTGHAFYSATGSSEVTTESGDIAGFGSKASYDAALNDKAINVAVADVLDELVAELTERPWRTDVLKVQGSQLYLSAGAHQGLIVGDTLGLFASGDKIENPQTGFMVELPPNEIGQIRVESLFGSDETNEGAIAKLTSGSLQGKRLEDIFVAELGDDTQ